MQPTPEETKRFRNVVRRIHVMHEDYHRASPDWEKCARVTTGRSWRTPSWAGVGSPGIRLENCAFSYDNYFGVSAYVDVEHRSFFGLLHNRWEINVHVGAEDGPWWDEFRRHLPIWEHEIELPENQPGWYQRERTEQWNRERALEREKQDAKVAKARKAFRA